MPRKKLTQPQIKEEIARRFTKAFEVGMGLSPAEVSRKLRYANQTTIQAIKRGKTLPDFTRLATYRSELHDRQGGLLNLHWLITGEGKPFIKTTSDELTTQRRDHTTIDDDIIILLSNMPPRKKGALVKLLIEMS